MSTPRDEFVFGTKNGNERKWYAIENLDKYDEILREDNRLLWERIRRHHMKEVVEIFTPIRKKYESEPEMVKVAEMSPSDAKLKFG